MVWRVHGLNRSSMVRKGIKSNYWKEIETNHSKSWLQIGTKEIVVLTNPSVNNKVKLMFVLMYLFSSVTILIDF